MSDIILRDAVAADAAALSKVITDAYAPFMAAGLNLPLVADGLAEDIRDHAVVVAVLDDQVVGGLVLVRADPPKLPTSRLRLPLLDRALAGDY